MHEENLGLINEIHLEQYIFGGLIQNADFFNKASKAGVQSIIDLRATDEYPDFEAYKNFIEEKNIEFHSIPISSIQDFNNGTIELAFELIDKVNKKIVISCGSGNRVGALMALLAHYKLGKSPKESVDFGLKCGLTKLQPMVEEILGLDQS